MPEISEATTGYYLLSYYERTEEVPTRPRRIRIAVNRSGVRAEYIERHPQPKPFGTWTQSDRFNHLYHALHADALHRELPVELFYEVFVDEAGLDAAVAMHRVQRAWSEQERGSVPYRVWVR